MTVDETWVAEYVPMHSFLCSILLLGPVPFNICWSHDQMFSMSLMIGQCIISINELKSQQNV